MKKSILSFMLMGALFAPFTFCSAAPKRSITALVVPALVTVGALYYVWSHWNSSRPVFSQPKSYDFALPAATKKHTTTIDVMPASELGAVPAQQAVKLMQYSVMQQGENNDGGASCGYHALKNAIGILTKNHNLFNDRAFIKRQFSLDPGTWREWVQAKQGDNGEWVHTEFYADLITRAFNERNIRCGWSILNSQGQAINDAHVGEDIYGVFRMLTSEDAYKHAFFVNTASGYNVGQHGHWFVVIMEKEAHGPTTYTVMDSLGHERHADNTVWTIIKSIHRIAKITSPEVLGDEKQKTKVLLLDVVNGLSDQKMNTNQKEKLTSMVLDLYTILLSQGAVDEEIKKAMVRFMVLV